MSEQVSAGTVIWITGATSGIGRSLAIAYAATGARLILSGRRADALADVQRQCGTTNVHTIPFDLADLDSIPGRAAEAVACFGQVDTMVHNAGLAARERVVNTSRPVHEQILHTNYLGPALLTQALLPAMIERHDGHFVVISSMAGTYGSPQLGAYAAAKHALHGFFESLRAEEYDRGIVVTLVIPGFIKTDITAHALTGSGGSYGRVLSVYDNAMSADECARKIVQAVTTRRQEVVIGGVETWMIQLKRWLPRIHAMVIRSHPVRTRNKILGRIPILGRRWRTPKS